MRSLKSDRTEELSWEALIRYAPARESALSSREVKALFDEGKLEELKGGKKLLPSKNLVTHTLNRLAHKSLAMSEIRPVPTKGNATVYYWVDRERVPYLNLDEINLSERLRKRIEVWQSHLSMS